jgi:hypothetical protein
MTHWKLAQACVDMGALSVTTIFHLTSALQFFKEAFESGNCQSVEWQDGLLASSLSCWEFVRDLANAWN